jgi:DNA-directed RNA polymerase specialized sigma24 family protein
MRCCARDEVLDCTQDILILVVTHLGSFEGRSKLLTWVYTIASRHLLRARKRAAERSVKDPGVFGAWLDAHVASVPYATSSEAEYRELCEEVRIWCTYGMLLVLSRELRPAYVLGDLLELSDKEGAEALEITPLPSGNGSPELARR